MSDCVIEHALIEKVRQLPPDGEDFCAYCNRTRDEVRKLIGTPREEKYASGKQVNRPCICDRCLRDMSHRVQPTTEMAPAVPGDPQPETAA